MHLKNILYTRTLYISDLEGRYKKDTVTIFALYRFLFTRVHTKVVLVQCALIRMEGGVTLGPIGEERINEMLACAAKQRHPIKQRGECQFDTLRDAPRSRVDMVADVQPIVGVDMVAEDVGVASCPPPLVQPRSSPAMLGLQQTATITKRPKSGPHVLASTVSSKRQPSVMACMRRAAHRAREGVKTQARVRGGTESLWKASVYAAYCPHTC